MLADKYNHKESEKKWQQYWREKKIYAWKNDLPREKTFVIDTPPPTVSGLLHMGHVFSYTQADFVARFWRMRGKDVFYPMGFDDNGLPTERLVEKEKNIRVGAVAAAADAAKNLVADAAVALATNNASQSSNQSSKGPRLLAREDFIAECKSVVDEAEKEFELLFNAIALSVDWEQKYQTISPKSQALSQASFVDLWKKGLVERKFEPVFWDVTDRTALAQADLVDKEVTSSMNEIEFAIDATDAKLIIMTTRPELLPACVAVMINSSHVDENGIKKWSHLIKNTLDENGEGFTGSYAHTALFGVKVPIIADNDVKVDKGTGAVMCCTFGDETDIKWWKKYDLELRLILDEAGRIIDFEKYFQIYFAKDFANKSYGQELLEIKKYEDFKIFYESIQGKKIKEAQNSIIETLKNPSQTCADTKNLPLLTKQESITRAVKCAERSGMPIEILVKQQWFIKILDKKTELKRKAQECNWLPEYMRVRIEQWIDGLSWDWCISRQRFFGVPFPLWYVSENGGAENIFVADLAQLPCDPLKNLPKFLEGATTPENQGSATIRLVEKNGVKYLVRAETDILDTWATSSISPQLSSGAINEDMLRDLLKSGTINQATFDEKLQRHQKLFPADMRPQAHEIIRTWAFYTIAKALLHEDKIPWKNIMISGWCLAADKTKMSKSKGNVVTPTALIEEKGSDIVRYWASTTHLGADTAYSEEVFKIGQKLTTKLFNAAKFVDFVVKNGDVADYRYEDFVIRDGALCKIAAISDSSMQKTALSKTTLEAIDAWILSKLHQTIKQATLSFEKFEYARAREKIEEFFWHDYCDNYLEIVKVRAYGLKAEKLAATELTAAQKQKITAQQLSGIHTLYTCLNTLIKLFAPFIPHLAEEIYSSTFAAEFAQTQSINARGTWPNWQDFFFEQKFVDLGEAALAVIFEVRKFKSDNNLSMKTTLKKLTVKNPLDLSEILADLGNVCNALELEFSKGEAAVVIEV